MDFDDAKENIQPLAQGRNASILHASLKVDSSQELLAQRKLLEKEIHNYSGEDPLSVWYNYIEWIEQSYPSGGKESGLDEVLAKCLGIFESEDKYKQDRRMIKLYIKFIDSHKDPAECYQQLFSAGIGTMVADFYIAWAYCYDLVGNTRKADEIFLRGIACRAQPLEELQEARQHFGFSVAQRLMYKEDEPIVEETNRQLYERRMALTSLRAHRKKVVASVRTGAAIKSLSPGKVQIELPSTSSQRGNKRVQVFRDENEKLSIISTSSNDFVSANEVGKSVVRSMIDAARNQENQKEPGPWNKTCNRKKGKLFGKSTKTNELGFEIHEDDNDDTYEVIRKPCIPPIPITDSEIKFDKPFIYPPNFCAISKPIKGWITPVTTEEMPDVNSLPEYNKYKLYPRPNVEFQPEELKAYNILRKRGIKNDFTKERDVYWACGPNYNLRLYPHFATKSKPQKIDSVDEFFVPEKLPGLKVPFDEIYNIEEKIERQYEEILALRFKRNDTIIETADMEETMCASEKIQRRKSFFPMRKSMAPATFIKTQTKISVFPEQNDKYTTSKLTPNIPEQEIGELKPDVLYENSIQKLSPPKTINTTAPVITKHVLSGQKSSNTVIHKQSENTLLLKADTEQKLNEKASPKPFEIFNDSSVKDDCTTAKTDGFEFQFKTPALPIPSSTLVATAHTKLPFEIFDDGNLVQQDPNFIPKADFSSCTGGFFDPEESCSTQTFNIFLKAQSVSTPKVMVKSKPQKNFGNILKEVTPSIMPEQKDNTENRSLTTADQNSPPIVQPVTSFSPPLQQLSTILETSEHGSTQGTHTTGATTKSTISSPEFDIDSHVQATTNTGTNHPQTVLETVYELSCESSSSPIVDKVTNSPKVENININTSKTQHSKNVNKDSSVFQDFMERDKTQVGNFSRLEEKEDTRTGSAFKTIPPLHFQDDKTETISKTLFNSQQVKYQDDKTETISKMMFEEHLIPTKFQEDKTETISKMLLAPPHPIKFSEDKTETISKIMLTPSELPKVDIDKNKHQDDSFEFFGQTPPKTAKQLFPKQIERSTNFHTRTATENRTPLNIASKRFCDINTPEVQTTKPSAVLFEDELQPYMKNTHLTSMRKNVKDSLLPDFSIIEGTQPEALAQGKIKTKSKSVFRDSYIPDFSIIEDSQPQTKEDQSKNQHKMINESILPELSLIKNTQLKSGKPEQNNSRNFSMLSDFFPVSETQPNESIVKSSQSIEPRYLKQSSVSQNRSKSDVNINFKQVPDIISQKTQDGTTLKNILMDTFVKDFSEINEPPAVNDAKQVTLLKPNKNNSSLRFLNDSFKKNAANTSINKDTKPNFLMPGLPEKKLPGRETHFAGFNDKYFELNCETEMFGTNISMIKNSTWLPNHGPPPQIQEKSLHIKSEDVSSNSLTSLKTQKQVSIPHDSAKQSEQFVDTKYLYSNDFSIEISASEFAANNADSFPKNVHNAIVISESPEQSNEDNNMSIYYKQTPKTPKSQIHIWDDADAFKSVSKNQYVHAETDLNQTRQIIENICVDPNVNPFNVDLINAFLEQHYVISYLESLPTCELVGCIQRLKQGTTININGVSFTVIKLIGEGAYGAVFCGKETKSGKVVAMKQEKPPNFWEYYICLEIGERVRSDEMLHAYMSVDYALIGNNSSILISKFSQYGSLITVCNKIKKHTMKNVDEYVVMLLTSELLEILDHLHAVNIIHADVKADNFLLMNKLTYPPSERHLQLIDFGVSIDMKLFNKGQTFSFVHNDNSFKCPEMRERRPWTYQLDLYGLAGVVHVLLFGKYMDIEKNARGIWMHKTHVPRYINKDLWNEIFKTLLNIRDCNSMPNLQDLRALLKKEMEEKEKYVLKMINEFNRALSI